MNRETSITSCESRIMSIALLSTHQYKRCLLIVCIYYTERQRIDRNKMCDCLCASTGHPISNNRKIIDDFLLALYRYRDYQIHWFPFVASEFHTLIDWITAISILLISCGACEPQNPAVIESERSIQKMNYTNDYTPEHVHLFRHSFQFRNKEWLESQLP